jgi:hypothetical protein
MAAHDDDDHDHDHHDHHDHDHTGHDHDDHDDHDEHDHGHDHHDHDQHDHEHDDHDHDEHDHEHEDISIDHHEESTIAVFQKSLKRPYAEAVEIVESRMRIIADAVAAKGGFIGHIKSVVLAEKERCMLSITDAGTKPQRRDLGGDSARFELVCIVLLVEDDDLRDIIRDAFKDYF